MPRAVGCRPRRALHCRWDLLNISIGQAWYFELVECARKVVLTGLMCLVMDGTATQIAVGLFVTFVSFGVSSYNAPFIEKADTLVGIVAIFSMFMVLLVGLLFKTGVAGDSDHAEISSAKMQPLMVLVIVLPMVVALVVLIHDGGNAFKDVKQVRREQKQRKASKRAMLEPSHSSTKNHVGFDQEGSAECVRGTSAWKFASYDSCMFALDTQLWSRG